MRWTDRRAARFAVPGTRRSRRTLAAFAFACAGLTALAYAQPAIADARPVSGEWRSIERFEGKPRATVVVREEGGFAGTLTLLGMTRGTDEGATLQVPFRDGKWDGTVLSFETTLPGGEGVTRWALKVTAPGQASLAPTSEDGKPVEDGPVWDMRRP